MKCVHGFKPLEVRFGDEMLCANKKKTQQVVRKSLFSFC